MPEIEETRLRFVDTNVWLYAFVDSDNAPPQHRLAREVVSHAGIAVSAQVINETCVNLIKKAGTSEATIRQLITSFYSKYAVVEIDQAVLLNASLLREKYNLSYWDSVIVASALRAGCDVLYTEDMQHGLQIEDSLTIVNPFKS
jgi:predicted nucleic acid-binding protein